MLAFNPLNREGKPLRILAVVVGLGLLILFGGLVRLQILSRDRFEHSVQAQSYKSVRVPSIRGRILDRKGRELAGNTPRYRLDVYLEELSSDFALEYNQLRRQLLATRGPESVSIPTVWERLANRFRRKSSKALISSVEVEQLWRQARFNVVSNVIAQVSDRVGMPLTLSESELHRHWANTRALPLAIIRKLTAKQIATLSEQSWSIHGISVELQPVRHYPHGPLAVHLLGHLERADNYSTTDEETFDYRLRDYWGVAGLEKAFDAQLRGTAGAKSILVNSAGYRVGETTTTTSIPGINLITTLDLDLQIATEIALASVSGDERGAVVVLDVRTGDILAAASAPSFDPTEWIDGINQARWTNFYDVPKRTPLLNRITSGAYSPGSTFKIVTSLAALENGLKPDDLFKVEPDPSRPSKGAIFVGKRKIGDTAPPGDYNFRRAFIRSSNSYFIDQGISVGFSNLLSTARRFHFGEPTGIPIPSDEDRSAWMPTPEEARLGKWPEGRLANFSIGQEITVTPLQLTLMVAAVANGGTLYYPRLIDRSESSNPLAEAKIQQVRPGQIRSHLGARSNHLLQIREAMRDDVLDNEGTGKGARVVDYEVCGKTGTAEIKANGITDKVTWFASFAPYEAPRYAVVVMVESGSSGGGTCAPVARRIYEHLRDRDRNAGLPLTLNQ